MGLCFLMTFYFAIRGWQSRSSWKWHLAATLSFYTGIGCKEVIVAAPFVLFLYQMVFIKNPFVQILKKSLVLYTGLITGLILLGVLVNAGRTLSSCLGHANISISQYAMTQPEIICHYLKLTIWPANLCLDYA